MARDRLRQSNPHADEFVPSIGVERRVEFEPGKAKEYKKGIYREIGKQLGAGFRKRYHILDVHELKLVIVDPQAVTNEVRHTHGKLRSRQAVQIAETLRDRLVELHQEETARVSFQSGRTIYGEVDHPHKPCRKIGTVGVHPLGWKGPRTALATHDAEGERYPLSILVEEARLCQDILGGGLGIDSQSLANTPAITLVERSTGPVPGRDLHGISRAVEEVCPEFWLGEPVITVRTGRRRDEIERLPFALAQEGAAQFGQTA